MAVMTGGLVADDLWLTAHDTTNFRPRLAEQNLGLVLAAGLLAELHQAGTLRLDDNNNRLHRVFTNPRGRPLPASLEDPALDWVLWALDTMEKTRLQQPIESRLPAGHDARTLLAYLAVDHRAEDLVTDRMMRRGLLKIQVRKGLFGGETERRVPRDTVAAATPANRIVVALNREEPLAEEALIVAALYSASGLGGYALEPLEVAGWSELKQQVVKGLSRELRALLKIAEQAFGDSTLTGRR
jgi:hypothetical protein